MALMLCLVAKWGLFLPNLQHVVAAVAAAKSQEAVGQDAAFEKGVELVL